MMMLSSIRIRGLDFAQELIKLPVSLTISCVKLQQRISLCHRGSLSIESVGSMQRERGQNRRNDPKVDHQTKLAQKLEEEVQVATHLLRLYMSSSQLLLSIQHRATMITCSLFAR